MASYLLNFLWSLLIVSSIILMNHGCSGGNKSSASNSSGTTHSPTFGEDPLYSFQWHLSNTGQLGGTSGEDVQVESVWNGGNKGENQIIAVVDDGVELGHEDLIDNLKAGFSYEYATGNTNSGGPDGIHGTAVAGLIVARDFNALGVKGVASRSQFVSYNVIADGNSADSNIQDALTRNANIISVSNNSWGFADDTGHFYPLTSVFKTGLDTGLSIGRNGRGTVYVWSAGNGGTSNIDESNYDGLANTYRVIAVAAIGDNGKKATYSEKGANLWISSPSLGNGNRGLATTDLQGSSLGHNKLTSTNNFSNYNYTKNFGGTSAAAPVVSGVVSLMLTSNPLLSWRDVKIILAQSARKNDAADSGWSANGAHYPIHYSYGFGAVNAESAVELARTWNNVGAFKTSEATFTGPWTLTDGVQALTLSGAVSGSGISFIEFVEITINMNHADWGEVEISLNRNSHGYTTSSRLSHAHQCYHRDTRISENCIVRSTPGTSWTFGSARHLGEAADGTWQLVINEIAGGTNGGILNSWSIKVYGH